MSYTISSDDRSDVTWDKAHKAPLVIGHIGQEKKPKSLRPPSLYVTSNLNKRVDIKFKLGWTGMEEYIKQCKRTEGR